MSRRAVLTALSLAVSALLLHVLAGVHRWLPELSAANLMAPTVETAVVFGALAALLLTTRKRARPAHWLLAGLLAGLVLFGIGEGFYQAIFRKGFVPWTDLGFLPALLNMVFGTTAFRIPALVVLAVALLAAVVTAAFYGLLRWIDWSLRLVPWPAAAGVAGLMIALSVAVIGGGPSIPLAARAAAQLSRPNDAVRLAAAPAVGPGAGEAGESDAGRAQAADSADAAARVADAEYHFAALKDRSIHLLIVESYGHTLFTNQAHRALIGPVYEELQGALDREDYSVSSSFLTSPAFGGRSWLADATILTGAFIDSQHKYDTLVETATRNLTHILGDAGYHRVLAAPGTYQAEAEWRSFYEFDQYLFRYDFDYRGPFVSFGAMPDQFLLYRTHQLTAGVEEPLFVNYVLVSSHVPFDRLPRYVDDWDALGNGSIFSELELRLFDNNWLSGGEYPEGYVASIHYSLQSVVNFITEVVQDDSLFIVIGDHQPRIPISEPESTFSVPVHVIARDAVLVSGFTRFGFTPGLRPEQDLPHQGMDALLGMLLDVAHGGDRSSPAAGRAGL